MAYQPNAYRLLGKLIGANMNTTSDQTISIGASKYFVDKVIVTNASTSLTLAVGGLYTAASKGGTQVIGNTQVFSGLTASTKIVLLTSLITGDVLTAGQLYLSLTTAQGGVATADIFLFGYDLS
jgi:hypothetical protein